MTRTVVWKIRDTISRVNGQVSLVQSKSESEIDGDKYLEKLKENGETVISVERRPDRLIITLE